LFVRALKFGVWNHGRGDSDEHFAAEAVERIASNGNVPRHGILAESDLKRG
jgi:hypothetical protein